MERILQQSAERSSSHASSLVVAFVLSSLAMNANGRNCDYKGPQ